MSEKVSQLYTVVSWVLFVVGKNVEKLHRFHFKSASKKGSIRKWLLKEKESFGLITLCPQIMYGSIVRAYKDPSDM